MKLAPGMRVRLKRAESWVCGKVPAGAIGTLEEVDPELPWLRINFDDFTPAPEPKGFYFGVLQGVSDYLEIVE